MICFIRTFIFLKCQLQVFGSKCNGYDMGESVAKWLSNFILNADSGLRLIVHLLPAMQTKSSSFFGFEKVRHILIKLGNIQIKNCYLWYFIVSKEALYFSFVDVQTRNSPGVITRAPLTIRYTNC